MEIFINEISLHGQYASEKDFRAAVVIFMGVFDMIHQKKVKAYKNLEILCQRQAIQNKDFTSSFEAIKDQSFKRAFREIVFNKSNPKDWALEKIHSQQDTYYCKLINEFVDGKSLAEVAARNSSDKVQRVLVNFQSSDFKQSPIEIHKNDEPNALLLDFIETKNEFVQWIEALSADAPTIESGVILWSKREEIFPNLIFCKNVCKMIEDLKSTMPNFIQIVEQLWKLDRYAAHRGHQFVPDALPIKGSPESTTRLRDFSKVLTWECPDGVTRLFSWHVRFTPGAGRIHFYPLENSNKILIGSIANQNTIK